MCSTLQIQVKPHQLCNCRRFLPFLSRKKNSPSIFIFGIAICHSQGASVPLSLASAGSSVAKNSWRREPLSTLNIKNRKGSTGVNNAWERIPLCWPPGSPGDWLLGRAPSCRGDQGICFAPASENRLPANYRSTLRLPRGREGWKEMKAWASVLACKSGV